MHSRIDLNMSTIDGIYALSGGNPGAVRVCMEILQQAERIDPDSALGSIGVLFDLDRHRIYEGRIWCLYKDVCREDLTNMLGVLRAVQLGYLPAGTLARAIDGDRSAVNVAAKVAKVRARLPRFGGGASEAQAAE